MDRINKQFFFYYFVQAWHIFIQSLSYSTQSSSSTSVEPTMVQFMRTLDDLLLTEIKTDKIPIYMKKGPTPTNESLPSKQQKPIVIPPPEFQWISNLVHQFRQQIHQPIQIRQNLAKNSEQQRCLIHSIPYSIYCTICRKVLCASCMYNSPQHRRHRVIPIENATQEIKEDIATFQSKIGKIYNQAESLVQENRKYLIKIEKQYNPLTTKIKQFYESMRLFLRKKEKQQLQIAKQIKETALAQINRYNLELSRISYFIIQKLKSTLNSPTSAPLPSRVILENLSLTSKFVNQSYLDCDKFKFPADVNKVINLQNQLQIKIDSLFCTFQTPLASPRSVSKSRANKSMASQLSITDARLRLRQQTSKLDVTLKRKNLSISNIAHRSHPHKL